MMNRIFNPFAMAVLATLLLLVLQPVMASLRRRHLDLFVMVQLATVKEPSTVLRSMRAIYSSSTARALL
jgi:hypothetical protein